MSGNPGSAIVEEGLAYLDDPDLERLDERGSRLSVALCRNRVQVERGIYQAG